MITYRRTACAPLLLLLLLTLPAVAQAQSSYDVWLYDIWPDNTAHIVGYTGAGGAAVIPSTIPVYGVDHPVSTIGAGALEGNTSLTSVTIPNTVTSIETNAFGYCTGLTNVTIGDSVTNIEDEAFMWTSLVNVTNPSSVSVIGNGAFQAISTLMGVYFEGNAPTIVSGAFFNDNTATIYYLAGTTGWGATVDGRPTALWTQQTQSSSLTITGVTKNPFGFTITGSGSLAFVVEACANLANPTWQPLQTNSLSGGSFYFTDPQGTSFPARFYRVLSP
jgi:hypothetical protein